MANAALAKKPVEAPKKFRLAPQLFKGLEYEARSHRAYIPQGMTVDDIIQPDYWGHVAQKVRKGAFIYASCDDNSWFAWLWVVDQGQTWLRCRVITHTTFEDLPDLPPDLDLYRIDKNENGWRVVHKESKAILATGLGSEEAAQAFVKNHAKV